MPLTAGKWPTATLTTRHSPGSSPLRLPPSRYTYVTTRFGGFGLSRTLSLHIDTISDILPLALTPPRNNLAKRPMTIVPATFMHAAYENGVVKQSPFPRFKSSNFHHNHNPHQMVIRHAVKNSSPARTTVNVIAISSCIDLPVDEYWHFALPVHPSLRIKNRHSLV